MDFLYLTIIILISSVVIYLCLFLTVNVMYPTYSRLEDYMLELGENLKNKIFKD